MRQIEKLPRFTIDGIPVSDSLQNHIEELFSMVKPAKREIMVEEANSVEIFYDMEVPSSSDKVALNSRTNRLEKVVNCSIRTETMVKIVKDRKVTRQITNSVKRYYEVVEI